MNNFKNLVSIFIFTGIIFIVSSCKNEELEPQNIEKSYALNYVPALTNREYDLLASNKKANIIRNLHQFDQIVEKQLTPLRKVSPENLAAFRADLVFRKNRLVGLGYNSLKNSLTEEEFHEVLAIFGIDTKNGFWEIRLPKTIENSNVLGQSSESGVHMPETEYTDYKEYECLETGTCLKAKDHICLTGC